MIWFENPRRSFLYNLDVSRADSAWAEAWKHAPMDGVMQSRSPLAMGHVLSAAQFSRLQSLLVEVAGEEALHESSDRFTVVIAADFKALLEGDRVANQYQVRLTFEPEVIARFVVDRPLFLAALQANPQPNAAQRQTALTQQLLSLLLTQDSVPHLQFQLAQLTTQVRQSLDLPIILQTAVEQAQQALHADRLLIYQLNHGGERSRGGFVAYEAKASEQISSVLHLADNCEVLQSSEYPVLYCQGLALAIEDITVDYAATPCLVKFLQLAQVRSKLIAPIFVDQSLWGFLLAHQCNQPRRWQVYEQEFLQQVAENLAIGISQAQLYQEVQRQKQTLEQRVMERTRQLQDVTQAAQAASRAKSEFLASVTHELRTPLTCIIGMSTTLQRWSQDTLNDRQQNFLQMIRDSGEQLLSLINDILDVSQAEAEQISLTWSAVSPSLMARQTLKTFEGQAALAGLELELDVRTERGDRFTADPRRIQQVLFNLLDNALKFTPEGGKVTLRVFRAEQQIVFQIQDTGIGIAASQIPLLFQKFQQLDSGYQRQYQGTGLGLALAKQLVELHGGWVEVESTVNVGSLFTMRLPLSQTGASAVRTPAVSRSRGRVVLIEQDEDTASVICDLLTAAEYQVIWVLEGAAAIDQIEALRPFVVITNAQLADIESGSLMWQLRRNPATKEVRVIVMGDRARSQDWLTAGADDFLTLPIRPDLLIQKVMRTVPPG
jgi:two-component system, sensor histidine kinase and response regulator